MSTEINQRVIAPDDNDLAGNYLTFFIEDVVYGIELLHVIEIISIQTIAAVPDLPMFIKGIVNLRGRIVPVIDVRLRIGMQERAYDEHTCIIVVDCDETTVGLIVDSVSGVANYFSDDLSQLPPFTNINTQKYLSSISKVDDRLVLNIDCSQFLNT